MTKYPSEQPAGPSEIRQHKNRSAEEPKARVQVTTRSSGISTGPSTGGSTGTSTGTSRNTGHSNGRGPIQYDDQESADAVDELISSIEQELRNRENDLKMERSEHTKLLREHHKLRKDSDTQAKELIAKKNLIALRDRLMQEIVTKVLTPYTKEGGIERLEKWNEPSVLSTLEQMLRDAVQAKSLHHQVQSLQDEMLAKVEKVHAVSDDTLARDFRNIASLVKALSRTTQPPEEVDMGSFFAQYLLLQDVSPRHWSSRAQKKLYIEAWFWCVLIHFVFKNPFAIFGAEGVEYNKLYMKLFGDQHLRDWPIPTQRSESWRRTTIDQLAECMHPDILTCWDVTPNHNILERDVITNRTSTWATIESVLTSFCSSSDDSSVRIIVEKAIALALQMHLQKFRLMITWPTVGDLFDGDEMTSIPNIDGEETDEGVVAFVINPCLTKYGDAHGKNLDQRYDIVPSLVLLDPLDQGSPPPQSSQQAAVSER
jgi:hypothetical protein